MVTKTDIVKNIEETRNKIGVSIEEVSDLINQKLDITKNARLHPGRLILFATVAGLSVALISTKSGRKFLSNIVKPASVLGTAYFSRMATNVIKKKVQAGWKQH